MGYKIITIKEAKTLDFETVEQTSLETARKSIDGTKVLISSDTINDIDINECRHLMNTAEWYFEEDFKTE